MIRSLAPNGLMIRHALTMAPNPALLGLCNPLDLVYSVGVNVLTPGTHCGNITVRAGNCYLCYNCGHSMGCS